MPVAARAETNAVTSTSATAAARGVASGFRRDIEGLRAVTALLVAGFHIWGNKVSGGVDVFFVISGYFITLTLLGHLGRYGRIRPGRYLARLGQRLAPMALLVASATIALVWVVLPSGRRDGELQQVIASLTSTENLYLAFQSVDYLAQDQPRSAAQQFWAMSVQGQFYVTWMLLALLAAWVAGRTGRSAARWLGITIVAVIGVSFAWSVHQTSTDQTFAYFSPLTRVWEFGIGAIIALSIGRMRIPSAVRVAMVWVGLAGILACAAFLPVESAFPGAAALWPTLAAALVLVSGQKGDGLARNALLTHPLLVRMGGFAFAIYLWHWPLLIAARSLLGTEQVGWRAGMLVLVAAVALAWASSRWIERPTIDAARSTDPTRRRRTNVLLVVSWVAVTSTAATLLLSVRVADAEDRSATVALLAGEPGSCVGAMAVLAGEPDCVHPELEGRVFPAGTVGKDLSRPDVECAVKKWHAEARMCEYGEVGSERRIALIGNSHAMAWFPALEQIATDAGWELRVWYKTGCSFAMPQRDGTNERLAEECDEWVSNVQADIVDGPPIAWAVTSTHRSSRWDEPDAAFSAAWQPLIERGTDIVVLRDYPASSDASLACVDRAGAGGVDECSKPRSEVADGRDEMWRAASGRIPGAHALDLTDAFCDAERCFTVAGHVKVYRDHSHLSSTYATTLAAPLERMLDEARLVADVVAAD